MIGAARDRVKASAQVSMLRRANGQKHRENPSGKGAREQMAFRGGTKDAHHSVQTIVIRYIIAESCCVRPSRARTHSLRKPRQRGRDDMTASVETMLARAEALAIERGVALTPLRRQVYELVLKAHKPIGAYDLIDAMEPQRGARVPPTTVYRALDFLVENGFVHRIESKNAFIACCDAGKPHESQFLICEECGNTLEIQGRELASSLSASPPAHGFQVHHQVVELSGLCADCQKKHRGV
jgi:Fur family transcriptional regulator, zinc uptake regulator